MITESGGEFWATSGIVCPHCKYVEHDISEYGEGEHTVWCNSCGVEFDLSVTVTFHYSSTVPGIRSLRSGSEDTKGEG